MKLSKLVGEHLLDAVDFSDEQVKTWGNRFEACQVMRFRLDGKCYTATEDPCDGYRSCMLELAVSEDAEMNNVFAPMKVIGRYRTKGSHGDQDDVLELIDAVTGQIVIEVGTESVDDYYPGFVASFHPEVMAHNVALNRGCYQSTEQGGLDDTAG